MNRLFLLVLFGFLSLCVFGQTPNSNYDEELAKELGADDYGMKKYIFVILKTGTNKTEDKAFIDSCFAGHLSNIKRLVEEQKLIVAGPFFENEKDYRGLFILNVDTKEKAIEILKSDPAIKEDLLSSELFEWYGSAALPLYLEASDKVWKIGY
ncbi:YciI family protein [Brumimicrobium aurantiacum]|uniref:YCII-related domain-containing protein n=1 Tax=Brumimicrobium aurantiacum TaxID=1737063 RepID=A0A3E1EW49_9FLAO|nr:YciI family protein [Brumimicrobium aurantiacum]RFC53767.1 hypothetical protein DXU93_11610 [Brumimicrobium aurantiacum]